MLRECEGPNRKIEKHGKNYPIVLLSWLETLCPYIKTNVNCIITEVMIGLAVPENNKVRQNNMIKSSLKVKLYMFRCTFFFNKWYTIYLFIFYNQMIN